VQDARERLIVRIDPARITSRTVIFLQVIALMAPEHIQERTRSI
jgi:hypothetical protein